MLSISPSFVYMSQTKLEFIAAEFVFFFSNSLMQIDDRNLNVCIHQKTMIFLFCLFFFRRKLMHFCIDLFPYPLPEINELLLFIFSVPWTREAYFAAKIVRSRKWTRFTCTGIGIRLQWSAIKANVTGNLTRKICWNFWKEVNDFGGMI